MYQIELTIRPFCHSEILTATTKITISFLDRILGKLFIKLEL